MSELYERCRHTSYEDIMLYECICHLDIKDKLNKNLLPYCIWCTVYAIYFARVLFSRISRVSDRENFHFTICFIDHNVNITKIVKLCPREFPILYKIAKNYVREIYGVYSITLLKTCVHITHCLVHVVCTHV